MINYKNILLVEDDKDDQDFFIEVLKEVSPAATCSVAANGHKALQLIPGLAKLPDVIFLDLNMPVMDGREFLRLVKTDPMYSAYKNIPVVILTTSSIDQQKCYELGACLYITKPTSMQAFRTILTELLKRDLVKEAVPLRELFAGEDHLVE